MCWVRADEKERVLEASAEKEDGFVFVEPDMTEWELFTEDGIALYALAGYGLVRKRTDIEIKRERRDRR